MRSALTQQSSARPDPRLNAMCCCLWFHTLYTGLVDGSHTSTYSLGVHTDVRVAACMDQHVQTYIALLQTIASHLQLSRQSTYTVGYISN